MPHPFNKSRTRATRHYLTRVVKEKMRISKLRAQKRTARRIARQQKMGKAEVWD